MAKPSDTVKIWASTTNHATGDYIGSATKVDAGAGVIQAGFVPGDVYAPTAEETNNEFNVWSRYIQWVKDGVATADVSAHIVETDSSGNIRARRGLFESSANPAVYGEHTNGGYGVSGKSSLSHGVYGEGVGVGNAYGVYGKGTDDAGGVRGVGGTGTLAGGYFTGSAFGAGVRAEGGGSGGFGVRAAGTGGAADYYCAPDGNYGLDIACTATAVGGARIQANGQLALYITQDDPNIGGALLLGDSAASTGVMTLEARAFGGGYAIQASNTAGTGFPLRLRPKSAAPTVGAILVDSQAARPTNTATAGQLAYLAEKQFAHSSPDDSDWRGFLSTVGGTAQGRAATTVGQIYTANVVNAWVTILNMTSTGADAPKVAGREIVMRVSCMARSNGANLPSRLALQVLDVTAGGPPVWVKDTGNGFALPDPGAAPLVGWTRIHAEFAVTVPLAGTRTWRLQYATALNSLAIQDVVIAFGPGMQ